MSKQISVIIPVYNVEKYLSECIESVLKQTYNNIEIILINDASTDKSGEICKQYADKHSNIIFIDCKENKGVVHARGLGLERATGEYIGFVDSDDWIEPEMYEKLAEAIKGVEMSVCAFYKYTSPKNKNERGHEIVSGMYSGEKYEILLKRMLYDFEEDKLQPFTPYIWNKLYIRYKLIDVYTEMDESISYAEDSTLLYKYILRCNGLNIIDNCLYNYRYREDSVCHSINENQLLNIHKVYNSLKDNFRQYELDKELTVQLQKWVEVAVCDAINRFMGFEKNIHIPRFWLEDISRFKEKNIVLYGAGIAGQDYYWQLSKRNINIVAWVDREYERYQALGYDVLSPEYLRHIDYDVVLVAVTDKDVVLQIKEWLLSIGIDEKKIFN